MLARALLLGAALLVGGCPPPPAVRAYPPPSAGELLRVVAARADALRSLRATAKVDHRGPGGDRVKVKVAMLLARGGRLRLEVDSPLGGTVATLVSDGADFALLDVRANRFLAGPASACNVARLLRIELPPQDIAAVLMGGAPIEGEPTEVKWDASEGGREVLVLRTPDGGRETLRLDARARSWDLVAAERRDAQGAVLWRLHHQDFELRDGVRLPRRSGLEQPPAQVDVELRWREQEPNVAPPAGVFRLEPPEGMQVETVTCS